MTTWRCDQCHGTGRVYHDGPTGMKLINEIRVQHGMKVPYCKFWDLKIKIRTVRL